jgi:hypothetical protein
VTSKLTAAAMTASDLFCNHQGRILHLSRLNHYRNKIS